MSLYRQVLHIILYPENSHIYISVLICPLNSHFLHFIYSSFPLVISILKPNARKHSSTLLPSPAHQITTPFNYSSIKTWIHARFVPPPPHTLIQSTKIVYQFCVLIYLQYDLFHHLYPLCSPPSGPGYHLFSPLLHSLLNCFPATSLVPPPSILKIATATTFKK